MADFLETPNMYPNLSALLNVLLNDQEHFRLNKINEIKDYFVASFTTVIGAPVGITSASFSLAFSVCTGIVKKTIINNKK